MDCLRAGVRNYLDVRRCGSARLPEARARLLAQEKIGSRVKIGPGEPKRRRGVDALKVLLFKRAFKRGSCERNPLRTRLSIDQNVLIIVEHKVKREFLAIDDAFEDKSGICCIVKIDH